MASMGQAVRGNCPIQSPYSTSSQTPKLRPVAAPSRLSRPLRLSTCNAAASDGATAPKVDPFAEKEKYTDNDLVSKFMIAYFSKVMSDNLGGRHLL